MIGNFLFYKTITPPSQKQKVFPTELFSNRKRSCCRLLVLSTEKCAATTYFDWNAEKGRNILSAACTPPLPHFQLLNQYCLIVYFWANPVGTKPISVLIYYSTKCNINLILEINVCREAEFVWQKKWKRVSCKIWQPCPPPFSPCTLSSPPVYTLYSERKSSQKINTTFLLTPCLQYKELNPYF